MPMPLSRATLNCHHSVCLRHAVRTHEQQQPELRQLHNITNPLRPRPAWPCARSTSLYKLYRRIECCVQLLEAPGYNVACSSQLKVQ
jgi:hypothetical protein